MSMAGQVVGRAIVGEDEEKEQEEEEHFVRVEATRLHPDSLDRGDPAIGLEIAERRSFELCPCMLRVLKYTFFVFFGFGAAHFLSFSTAQPAEHGISAQQQAVQAMEQYQVKLRKSTEALQQEASQSQLEISQAKELRERLSRSAWEAEEVAKRAKLEVSQAKELQERLSKSAWEARMQLQQSLDYSKSLDQLIANTSATLAEFNKDIRSEKAKASILTHGRLAYVWYLTDYDSRDIACAILVAAKAIHDSQPSHTAEFVVMHTMPNTSIPAPERFQKFSIRFVKVAEPVTIGTRMWKSSFAKLWAAELFDYHRIIIFDVDSYPLGNLDSLFDISPFPVELAAPRAYWLRQPFVQSGGPMVLDPQASFYRRDFAPVLEDRARTYYDSEMDYVNEVFKNKAPMLDGFYALLISEWCPTDKVYKYWQTHFGESASWVMQHAPLVHFIDSWKPWVLSTEAHLQSKCPGAQPEMLKVYMKWWNARTQVC